MSISRSRTLRGLLSLSLICVMSCSGESKIDADVTTAVDVQVTNDDIAEPPPTGSCSPIALLSNGRGENLKGCIEIDGEIIYFSSAREADLESTCEFGNLDNPGEVTARYWDDRGQEITITLKDACGPPGFEVVRREGANTTVLPSFAATHDVTIKFNGLSFTKELPGEDTPWEDLKELFQSTLGSAIKLVPLELALESNSMESRGELAALLLPWQFGLRHPAELALEQARVSAEQASGNFFAPNLYSGGVIERPWWLRPTDLILSESIPFPHVLGYLPLEPPPFIPPPSAFRSSDGASFSVGSEDVCNESLDACSGACGQGCYSDSCEGLPLCPTDAPLFSQGQSKSMQWTCTSHSPCQDFDALINDCSSTYSGCESWGRAACFIDSELSCIQKHGLEACLMALFGFQATNAPSPGETLTFVQTESGAPPPSAGMNQSDGTVECLRDELDQDGDGLSNKTEVEKGLDPFNPDTDFDGVMDGQDDCPTDPGTEANGCDDSNINPKANDCDVCSLNAALSLCIDDQYYCSCINVGDGDDYEEPVDCYATEQKCATGDPSMGFFAECIDEVSACSELCANNLQQDVCINQNQLCMCTGALDIEPYDCTVVDGHVCVPTENPPGEAECQVNPANDEMAGCAYVCSGLIEPICHPEDPKYLCLCDGDLTATDCSDSIFTDTCENAECIASNANTSAIPQWEFFDKCENQPPDGLEPNFCSTPGVPVCNYEDASQLCLCNGSGKVQNCDYNNPGWVCNGNACGPQQNQNGTE